MVLCSSNAKSPVLSHFGATIAGLGKNSLYIAISFN